MLENLTLSAAYVTLGFVISYLALEGGWHFTACKIKGGTTLKPRLFKELRKHILLVSNRL